MSQRPGFEGAVLDLLYEGERNWIRLDPTATELERILGWPKDELAEGIRRLRSSGLLETIAGDGGEPTYRLTEVGRLAGSRRAWDHAPKIAPPGPPGKVSRPLGDGRQRVRT